jgi:hypothetical protein
MRTRFPGNYRPFEDDFAKLWRDCVFVPDTNILLHLFRYGEKTRGQVLDTLNQLRPRVWIPYRVPLTTIRGVRINYQIIGPSAPGSC